MTTTKVLLFIPCFNEADRLKLNLYCDGVQQAKLQNVDLEYVFIDDGSSDTTDKLIEGYCQSSSLHHWITLEENAGKGNAIQLAYQKMAKNLTTETTTG